jgi:glycosyltransferase involved in cell wall biosynthesis
MTLAPTPTITTPPRAGGPLSRPAVPTVSVVIPARNEAANLRAVLPLLPPCVTEVVLVDGRSHDDTVAVTREFWPAAVIVEQHDTRGKGAAMCLGAAAASGDVIVFIDADGSMDPREVAAYVGALQGGADLAKGSRFATGGFSHDITVLRSAGNLGLRLLANLVHGQRWTELNYGFFAMWSDCLPRLGLDRIVQHGEEGLPYGHGFEIETLTFTRAARQGLRIVEVASVEYERIHGESSLLTFRDGWRVLRALLRERTVQPIHSAVA